MKIICPVCKDNRCARLEEGVSSFYSDKPYELACCENCGHIFISDPPSQEELDAMYRAIYNYEAHLVIEGEKKWRMGKVCSELRKLISVSTTIIDVGCMYGFALDVFQSAGYSNLVGVEISGPAVNRCREKGYDVFEGTFSQWLRSDSIRPDMENACIYLSHVIEHIQNLEEFFDEVNSVLKSGTYLIIMVPNSGAGTAKLLKKYWGWWQVPAHLHHFSGESLTNLLSANGFGVELSFRRGADSLFWLSTLASLMGAKSKSHSVSPFQKIIIRSFSFIVRYWFYLGNEELIVVAKKK